MYVYTNTRIWYSQPWIARPMGDSLFSIWNNFQRGRRVEMCRVTGRAGHCAECWVPHPALHPAPLPPPPGGILEGRWDLQAAEEETQDLGDYDTLC